jgi:hypothetical protein
VLRTNGRTPTPYLLIVIILKLVVESIKEFLGLRQMEASNALPCVPTFNNFKYFYYNFEMI